VQITFGTGKVQQKLIAYPFFVSWSL